MVFKRSMLAAASFAIPQFVIAEQGVIDDRVTFAQIATLDGPAAALGTGTRQEIAAAFEEANAKGGEYGRMLKPNSMDDGYEPDRSAALAKGVVEEDKHTGLIGPVGTPTSLATQPTATEAGIPFIGPFTSSGFLRVASHGNLFKVRATYFAETEAWIDNLVDQHSAETIAILY